MLTHSILQRRDDGTPRPRPRDPLVPQLHTNTVSTANTEPDLLPDADAAEGLAPAPLQTIQVDADVDGSTPVKLENLKYLGSYNWVDAPQPTIRVPGSPPEWRDRPLPFRVPFDSGLQIFDPNGYYMGSASTLIPLFRAVDVVSEENADTTMDWRAVDFVLDRSSLRKLLRWAQAADAARSRNTNWNTNTNAQNTSDNQGSDARPGTAPERTPQATKGVPDFRLDLQLGGKKTVLVERWDTRTCQYVYPPKYGCRSNFDEAATTPRPNCQSSKYHNRIVQYDLEGLKLVVRFEIDVCMRDDEDPSDLLANLSLSTSSSPSHPPPTHAPILPPLSTTHSDTSLTVHLGGAQTPQSSVIELATRSPRGLLAHKWHETYTQLLLSQTPHFFLAVHQNGLFSEVAKYTRAAQALARYDRDARVQRALRQLVRVLGAVQKTVKAHGLRGRLSLLCRAGRLEVFERAGDAGRLPECELARFGI